MNTGSSTQGMPAFAATSSAIAAALAPLRVEGAEIDQQRIGARDECADLVGAIVIDGMAPAASSTLAVKFCATALVMQCTRGRARAGASRMSAAMCGRSLAGPCISAPSAGMTRIRFDGLAVRLSARRDPPGTP